MARIPETFNFSSKSDMTMEELLVLLDRMYIDLATAVNSKPDLVQREVDGQVTDTFLDQGTININLLTDKVEILTNHVDPVLPGDPVTVTWTTLS